MNDFLFSLFVSSGPAALLLSLYVVLSRQVKCEPFFELKQKNMSLQRELNEIKASFLLLEEKLADLRFEVLFPPSMKPCKRTGKDSVFDAPKYKKRRK